MAVITLYHRYQLLPRLSVARAAPLSSHIDERARDGRDALERGDDWGAGQDDVGDRQ
jgi:hypothetical protein